MNCKVHGESDADKKGQCKLCRRASCKKWRDNHPEKAREISKAYQRKYREMYPERVKTINRKAKYGLTSEEYDDFLLLQNSKCGICGIEALLVVDHCHNTSKVRGLLCGNCNTGLGMFKDNSSNLKAALDWLEKQ